MVAVREFEQPESARGHERVADVDRPAFRGPVERRPALEVDGARVRARVEQRARGLAVRA